ncbi:MAG: LamG domain-containing protein [Planctomycetia bacterium]|nr:LamG domain-containing protein [Planctomycetia bacterium]
MRPGLILVAGVTVLALWLPSPAAEADRAAVRKALAFHASFDGQADADFARGDPKLYTASKFQRTDAKPGLHRPDVTLVKGKGKYGDALHFAKNEKAVVFYQADKNMGYRDKDWQGSVSFWLSLDPDKDLQPGYCDPVQITDKKWDDAAFFVDFTKDEKPRHFRLGIYSDHKVWNPKGLKFEQVPVADRPLSEHIEKPPFATGKWTHVLFTFAQLNSGKPDGVGKLYLDGKPVAGIRGRTLTFTWEPSKAAIMLGLSYIGLFDDLAVFDRALTDDEVGLVYNLENGIKSLPK